jgi:hypothetical protein
MEAAPKKSWSWRAFALGFGVAVGVVGGLELVAVNVFLPRDIARVRQDWPLADALVATRDLEEGRVLQAGDFAVGQIPQDVLTRSVLQPRDLPRLAGTKLAVAMQKGDWLMRAHFVLPPIAQACTEEARRDAAELGVADAHDVTAFVDTLSREVEQVDARSREAASLAVGGAGHE